jgi:hypothetical protein
MSADGRAYLVEQPGLLSDSGWCRVFLDGFRHGAGLLVVVAC